MDERRLLSSRPSFPLVPAGASLLILFAVACGAKAPSGSTAVAMSPSEALGSAGTPAPTLTILSPHSGERVSAPVPIRFRVQGFVPGKTSLLISLGEPGSSLSFELPLPTATGVVRLADHPMLSGRRTLTIELALDHEPLKNAEARVVLRNVVIEGDRGAG